MIDPHVHLRDWNQQSKETVEHGISVAWRAGIDGIFEMPNTDPALTSRQTIEQRIAEADKAIRELGISFFHGLYAGITQSREQIEEIVRAHQELFPRVVGLKMYAGHSTGNMGIIDEEAQRNVYRILTQLNYQGVLTVHCEKESELKPKLWTPENPFSHTVARSPEAEVCSVKDQIQFAQEAGYRGTLHIAHVSVPETLVAIEEAREYAPCRITCEVAPHHCVLYDELMHEQDGIFLKMNPPLRLKSMQEQMLQALIDGRIDCVATDHAPHTLRDKNRQYASGIPGLPFYPHFIRYLRERMCKEDIERITHRRIEEIFEIQIPNSNRHPEYDLAGEYEFNAFQIRKL